MKQPRSSTAQHKNLGGYSFTLAPGKPQKLYVGTYRSDDPKPQFRIILGPADEETVVHEELIAEQEDGHYALLYYFENYGQVTVRVQVERIS